MTRYKSRVARRSRRRARRGTRKQSGGMFSWLSSFFGPKTATAPAPAPPAVDATAAAAATASETGKKSWFSGLFDKNDNSNPPPPPPPPAAAAVQPLPLEQVGGRKTRHCRRSPHHHRK